MTASPAADLADRASGLALEASPPAWPAQEKLAVAFCCLEALAVALRRPPGWLEIALLHLAAAAGLCAAAALCRRYGCERLRPWLVLPLFLLWFELSGRLDRLFFARWQDAWLLRLDAYLPGGEPARWLPRLHSPALNEAMAFGYLFYYLSLPLLGFALVRRRRLPALRRLFLASTLAYLACNFLFPLLPAAGPRHTLGLPALGGAGIFGGCVNWLESWGGVYGSAFPSAHVAGALVATLACRRYLPRLGRVYLVLFALMAVATMYLRYHYFADVAGGAAIAALAWRLSRPLISAEPSPRRPVQP